MFRKIWSVFLYQLMEKRAIFCRTYTEEDFDENDCFGGEIEKVFEIFALFSFASWCKDL